MHQNEGASAEPTGLGAPEGAEPCGLGASPAIPCAGAQRDSKVVRFRKRPVVIEAVRVNAADYNGQSWDGFPFDAGPEWLLDALSDGRVKADVPRCTDYAEWKIETREGAVWAGPGDWIVRGIQGEIYPCGGDIFEQTYEPAEMSA